MIDHERLKSECESNSDTWELSPPTDKKAIVTETPYYDESDEIWAYDVETGKETSIKPSRDNPAEYEASNEEGHVFISWNDHYYVVQSIDLMDLPDD